MKKYINVYLKNLLAASTFILITCNGFANTMQSASNTWPVSAKQVTVNHPFPQNLTYTLSDGTSALFPNGTPESKKTAVQNYYIAWKNLYIASGPDYQGHQTLRVRLAKVATNLAASATNVKHQNSYAPLLVKKLAKNAADPSTLTVSEGQGYGMIITVIMASPENPNAQADFNKLFWFVKAHPSKNDSRLMGWIQPNPKPSENTSAFDGDADIALALVLADQQWGSSGEINYIAEAKTIITAIQTSTIGVNSHLPLLGDWVAPNSNSGKYNQWTPRPSDFMLDNFRTFGFITGDTAYWNAVVNSTHTVITHLQTQYSPTTGLLPDFTQYGTSLTTIAPASPNYLEGDNDGEYTFNAIRTPWRIGVDALLNHDATSLAQANKISIWIKSKAGGNVSNIHAGYQLNGDTLISDGEPVTYNASSATGPFGVAAMTVKNGGATQQTWLNNIYNEVKVFKDYDEYTENYYEHTIGLLSLLIMTGNYWNPMTFQNDQTHHHAKINNHSINFNNS